MNAKKVHQLLASARMHAQEAMRLIEEAAAEVPAPEFKARKGSLTDQVEDAMRQRVGMYLTAEEVARLIGGANASSVSVSLNRLVSAKRIQRVEPGVFVARRAA